MPTLFNSRLQRNLVNWLNAHSEAFEAIRELCCIIPPHSPVPNIVAIASDRLSDQDGPFHGAPDWLIVIRSPDHSTLTLQTKILHCLQNGTQSAWLIDRWSSPWENRAIALARLGTETTQPQPPWH